MADWTSDGLGSVRFAPSGRGRGLPRGLGPSLARFIVLHPAFAAILVLAAVLGLTTLAWRAVSHLSQSGRDLAADAPVLEAPAWSSRSSRRLPGFSFESPLFPREQVAHEARRHNPGGGREDIFTFGAPGGDRGFARVVAYRIGSEAGPPGTMFLEMARRAAEAGFAVARSAFPAPLPTRFGLLEVADLTLAGDGGEQRCMAWRMVADEQDLRVTGWLCGAEGKPVDRQALTCFAERLDLPAPQTDKGLRALFSAAERPRSPGCPISQAAGECRPVALPDEPRRLHLGAGLNVRYSRMIRATTARRRIRPQR